MPRNVFIDVDDTLVRHAGSKVIPMTPVIEQVRTLFAAGDQLYLWSTGGGAYAERIARELGIADCFCAFLPKPDLYLDDQPCSAWRGCRHVLPANLHQLEGGG